MKKILLVIVLIIGILSCGMPKEIEYPDENLKIENSIVLYKNKKYTGKMIIKDEKNGVAGEINLKDGKLEGKGIFEIGGNYLLEYNIMNGNLDGQLIERFEKTILKSEYKTGKIKNIYYKGDNTMEKNFSFDDSGRVNGTVKVLENGDIVAFKDGVGARPDWNMEFKMYINEDGKLVEESYTNGVLDDMYISDDYIHNINAIETIIFGKL